MLNLPNKFKNKYRPSKHSNCKKNDFRFDFNLFHKNLQILFLLSNPLEREQTIYDFFYDLTGLLIRMTRGGGSYSRSKLWGVSYCPILWPGRVRGPSPSHSLPSFPPPFCHRDLYFNQVGDFDSPLFIKRIKVPKILVTHKSMLFFILQKTTNGSLSNKSHILAHLCR